MNSYLIYYELNESPSLEIVGYIHDGKYLIPIYATVHGVVLHISDTTDIVAEDKKFLEVNNLKKIPSKVVVSMWNENDLTYS